MILLFQVIAIVLVLLIAFLRPQLGHKWSRAAWRRIDRLARRRGVSVLLVGLLALASSATVSLLVHMPQPRYHDEFSYLMAADTFARGRLTNPTHPMWLHFETFHVIHQPTYQSKYPPGQGLMLAAGQVVSGHAIVGVWVSIGLLAAAICWMLQGWLPPRWALLGGLLVVVHAGILLKWGQSYWGGAVAAIGGALVFGALRRIVRRPRAHQALLMGLGLGILANSRPFEGLIVSVPVAAMLLSWMFSKNGPVARVSIGRVALPIVAVLVPTGLAMGFYNLRVTGDPVRMPYQVYEASYGIAPIFVWQKLWRGPSYHHKVMRDYYTDTQGLKGHMRLQPVAGFIKTTMSWVERLWKFYLGLVLMVPLIMLPWLLRDKWMSFALLTCGVLTTTFLLHNWVLAHYAAPITGLVFVIVVQAMRHLHVWRWHGKRTGHFIVQAIPVICAASLGLSLAQQTQFKTEHNWSVERARILDQLRKNGGRHLLVVRYGSEHSWRHGEWVYNGAKIDDAKVIWAREMDASHNLTLLEYFRDRRVWLVEVNGQQSAVKLLPYPTG